MCRKYLYQIILICTTFFIFSTFEKSNAENVPNIFEERLALYQKNEALTQIPWYYIAAIDQYERNIQTDLPNDQLISINISPEIWYGPGNISLETDEHMIQLFNGIGKDGDGDGKADPKNPEDVLFTFSQFILAYGLHEDDIKI